MTAADPDLIGQGASSNDTFHCGKLDATCVVRRRRERCRTSAVRQGWGGGAASPPARRRGAWSPEEAQASLNSSQHCLKLVDTLQMTTAFIGIHHMTQ
jgi:hypothetical protein